MYLNFIRHIFRTTHKCQEYGCTYKESEQLGCLTVCLPDSLDLHHLPIDFMLLKHLRRSWFQRIRFCGRCCVYVYMQNIYLCTFVCMYVCMYVWVHVYTKMCMYECVYMTMYVCACMTMYICTCIHSFILAISIAPLQVLYYSEALPTTARILYRSFTPKRTGNCR